MATMTEARALRVAVPRAPGALAAAVRGAGAALEAFALPQRCPWCGAAAAASHVLCGACFAAVPRLSFPLCVRCLALGADAFGCARHARWRVRPAWVYDERAALAVHALKYAARTRVAATLAAEMARALEGLPRPDLVMAVPLHAARERERGHNQAERLATPLAAALGALHVRGVLVRSRHTPPQVGGSAAERRRNVRGAFEVRGPSALRGRRVLLVDDVVTTGATLEAALDALRAAGAETSAAALAWAQ